MVLREDGDAVVAVGQPSHAWVSGQLARAWGNESFGPVAPREEVCLGAEQHDVGMAAWDLEPELNPDTGRPQSFMEMALERHLELWSAAPAPRRRGGARGRPPGGVAGRPPRRPPRRRGDGRPQPAAGVDVGLAVAGA